MLKRIILHRHYKRYKKQRGMASMEAVAAIILYLAFLSFSLGFFGVVHSGIMNSIGARTYAFETFSNRTYLKYHRDTDNSGPFHSHKKNGFRVHSILTEDVSLNDENFVATQRNIAFAKTHYERGRENNKHMKMVENERDGNEYKGYSFNPVWIKAAYGICLNARCSPSP